MMIQQKKTKMMSDRIPNHKIDVLTFQTKWTWANFFSIVVLSSRNTNNCVSSLSFFYFFPNGTRITSLTSLPQSIKYLFNWKLPFNLHSLTELYLIRLFCTVKIEMNSFKNFIYVTNTRFQDFAALFIALSKFYLYRS